MLLSGVIVLVYQVKYLTGPDIGSVTNDDIAWLFIGGALTLFGVIISVTLPASAKLLMWLMGILSVVSAVFLWVMYQVLRLGPNGVQLEPEDIVIFSPPIICIALFIWLLHSRGVRLSKNALQIIVVVCLVAIICLAYYNPYY